MPVPDCFEGELCASGEGLALSYLGRPDLKAERFVDAPFAPGLRLYRTGDLVRQVDGLVQFLGRVDTQVKLRGYRIEPAGVEAVLERHPAVRQAAVILRRGAGDADGVLVAYVTGDVTGLEGALTDLARNELPRHARPARIIPLDTLPLTPSGKLDRHALAALPLPTLARATQPDIPAQSETPAQSDAPAQPDTPAQAAIIANQLEAALATVLGIPTPLPRAASFFDLGASSLMIVRVHERMQRALGRDFPITDFFRRGSIATLARHLAAPDPKPKQARPAPQGTNSPIAIVAMAGRFPGAPDVDTFWQAMVEGRELISHFTEDELDLPQAPGQVPARGVLDRAEWFDAPHFGLTPREADRLDPQHRVLLELA
jgi:hypothetical protein